MPSWEDVRRIALALPGAEESTSYRQPCFKVNGRPFVNTGRIDGAIVTSADIGSSNGVLHGIDKVNVPRKQ